MGAYSGLGTRTVVGGAARRNRAAGLEAQARRNVVLARPLIQAGRRGAARTDPPLAAPSIIALPHLGIDFTAA